jgi:glutamine synthetase
VTTLPAIPKDTTDRNRTSPFAFTGNKFEFRMVGSSQSLGGPNFVLNTIVAETLSEIAEHLQGARDVNEKLQALLKKYATEHEAVIYNGDNYTAAWAKEAEKRGLPNVRNCVDSINDMVSPENAAVLIKHGTLPEGEIEARHEILLENYAKVINIEARTMLNMARRQILPAVMSFAADVADGINAVKAAGAKPEAQSRLLKRLNAAVKDMDHAIDDLAGTVDAAVAKGHADKKAAAFRDLVVPAMAALRAVSDGIEPVVDDEYWPLPTYADMLFCR